MKLHLAIAAATLATGCASMMPSYRDAAGNLAPENAVAECQLQADMASVSAGHLSGFVAQQLTQKCMAVRGYRLQRGGA